MGVRSEFLAQLSHYLVGEVDLKTFREWHLTEMLGADQLCDEDQKFLYAVQTCMGDLLAGSSESSFKESIRAILSYEQSSGAYRQKYTFVSVIVTTTVPENKTSNPASSNRVENLSTLATA